MHVEGRKCVPFKSACEALGEIFNLISAKGICRVFNTAARVEELDAEIERVAAAGHIIQSEAQRLRGRMQFAEGQLYGRTGKRCIKTLKDSACRRQTKLLDHQILALRLFVKLLKSGKPRELCWDDRAPIAVFTDHATRESPGTLFVVWEVVRSHFSRAPWTVVNVNFLGALSKKQIIFEAETFCAVLAYLMWLKKLERRNSICFVCGQ